MAEFSASGDSPAHDRFCSSDGAEAIREAGCGMTGGNPVVLVGLPWLGVGCLSRRMMGSLGHPCYHLLTVKHSQGS